MGRARKRRPSRHWRDPLAEPDELLLNQGRETLLVEWILKEFKLQDLRPELKQAYYDLFGWVEYSEYASRA